MATETKRVYDIQVNGTESFNELRQAIEQLNDKLKTLNETSKEYSDTLAQLTEYQKQLADAMQGISTSAEKTDTSLTGIKNTVDSVADSISNLGEDVINSFTEGLAQGMAEAATNTEQMGESTEKSINSVKDLKQEIADLRDRLVTLDKGSDDYKATVQELIDAQVKLKEVMNAGKNETQAAEGSYNALSQRMSALKQVWKEATDETTRDEIGKQIAEINAQLKGMDASIGNFQRNVGNYKSALDGLNGSFVNWKQELKECKEAMQQLDPSTEAYAQAMQRAAEITHLMADQQEMIKYSSTDLGDQLNNIRGIASNLAAGYSAVNAAMGLFGGENEEVAQALLKVQQAMALVQGLQGIDGFIKRTKGLSQSMGLVTKATQANTVATKANAAASKSDAVAKGAEAVATEAAVPAQLSLNAAMEANPIGFIIGLIAALVTAFMLLKDKIMEMIGSNEEMSAAFDKVKAVLAGFGNVIKKSVINPVKLAIIPIKTLAKVIIDMFKGDWSKIGDDFKEGMEEMKDVTLDTINVIGAFKEGYDKKTAEQEEAARKERAAARQKELDNIIKDNEAKYGSDWKYTDEAKKLYEEMFKVRMEQYDQDSDEYREAQRDKLAYDREYTEKQNEAAEKAAEDEKKRQEQAAKEAAQRRAKMLSDFKSAFSQLIPQWTQMGITIQEMYYKWDQGERLFRQDMIETLVKYKKNLLGVSQLTKSQIKQIEKDVDDTISIMKKKFVKDNIFTGWAKQIREEYEKEFYNWDRVVSSWLSAENTKFEETKLTIGLEMPEDALRHFNDVFAVQAANINKQINKVNGDIQHYREMLNNATDDYKDFTDEQLAVEIPEFQKMLDKKNELEGKANQLRIDNFRANSEIIKGEYDKELSAITKTYDERKQLLENYFDWEENEKKNAFMDNEIEDLKRMETYYSEYYSMLIDYYNQQHEKYQQMAQDQTLTAEERANAEIKAGEMVIAVHQAIFDKDLAMLKNQREMYKKWAATVKDTVKGIGDIMSTISDSWSSLIELEKNEIQTELENGKISQEEANRREEQNKKSFEDLKKFQIAQAIINALASAVSAYQSMAGIPYVGPVLGAVAAAAALASGYAQVRQIQATEYGGGGGSTSTSSGGSTNFQLPDVMATEPELNKYMTGMDDTDSLNNAGGNGNGKGGETAIKAYVVESEVSASQDLARKRSQEVTF